MDEIIEETPISNIENERKSTILTNNSNIQTSASIEEIQDRLSNLIFIKYSKMFNCFANMYKLLVQKASKTSQTINQINIKTPTAVKLLIGILLSCIYSYFTQIHNEEFQEHYIYHFFIFLVLSYISFYWICNEIILSSIFSSVLSAQIILNRLNNHNIDVRSWICILMYPVQYSLIRKPIKCRFTPYFPLLVFVTPIYFFTRHLEGYSYLAIVPFATYAVVRPIIDNYLSGLRFYDSILAFNFIQQISLAILVSVAFIATFLFAFVFGQFYDYQKIQFDYLLRSLDPLPAITYLFPLLISGMSQNKFYLFSAIIMLFVPRDAENVFQYKHAIIDSIFCLAFGAFESIRKQNNFYIRYVALFVLVLLSFVRFPDI